MDSQKDKSGHETNAHVSVAYNTFDDRARIDIRNIVRSGDIIAVKDLSTATPSDDNFTIEVPITSIISEIGMVAGSPTATASSLTGASGSGTMPLKIPKNLNISSTTTLTAIGAVTFEENKVGKDVVIIINNQVDGGSLNEHLSSKIVRLGESKEVGGVVMDKGNVFDSLDKCTDAAKAAAAKCGEDQVVVKASGYDCLADKAKANIDAVTDKSKSAVDCFVFVGKKLFPGWGDKFK